MMENLVTLLSFQVFSPDLKGPFIGLIDRYHREITPNHHERTFVGLDEVIQFDMLSHIQLFLR
jgi:hypothetical protein